MVNIKVKSKTPIKNGRGFTFHAPCNCSEVTGITVEHPGGTQRFSFKDAHGNDLGSNNHLFTAGSLVKVVLDVTNSAAYIQNADTNNYLERRFDEAANEVAVERARIDQLTSLPEGSTAGDAELMDIRVDHTGKTWESAGAAVRGATKALREDIDNTFVIRDSYNLLDLDNLTERHWIGTDGGCYSSDPFNDSGTNDGELGGWGDEGYTPSEPYVCGYSVTHYIPVTPGDWIGIQCDNESGERVKDYALSVCCFDEHKEALPEKGIDVLEEVEEVIGVPEGVAYVRISLPWGTKAEVEQHRVAIVKGAAIVPYEPYGITIYTLKPECLPDNIPTGGGSDITVDAELSDTSENPVQNKVVTGAINGLDNRITNLENAPGGGSVVDPYTDYQPDIPENIGVLNAILNAKQLAEIPIKLLAPLPQKAGNWAPRATPYYGLPYSSSRVEEGFVPNFVSLYTFMTALQNPSSYLYTVDLGEKYNNQNGTTYYGAVCSTFCAYALNIVPNYTTHQWQDIPGMEYVPVQSVYALKLGDTICHKTSGHVVMVTDITRNRRGKIGTITITEAATVKVKVTTYTAEECANEYPTDIYAYHRYGKIHEVQHIQSPFVAVEDEIPMGFTYNTALIPRKGDKANWLAGVPVEIDLLGKTGYTDVEVYKDDTLFKTIPVAGGDEQPVDRTVYGLMWALKTHVGATATNRATTGFISSMDINIAIADGIKVKLYYYKENGDFIENTDEYLTGSVSVKDLIMPDGASLYKICAWLTDEGTITDISTITDNVTVSIPDNVDTIPIVWEAGGLSSSNGGNANNNARLKTDFLPLKNMQIVGSDDVQYYIYYYDADKSYIGNSGGWKSGAVSIMDGTPPGTAFYRLVLKNTAGTTISGMVAEYSPEIVAKIIGGVTIGGVDVIVLDDLTFGSYKARLTNGTDHSDWCYWIVVDAVSTATPTDNAGEVNVTFSASNATPVFVQWAEGKEGIAGTNGTVHISVLSDEEVTNGAAVCKYTKGTYKVRAAFQTEYGIIHTPLPDAITV